MSAFAIARMPRRAPISPGLNGRERREMARSWWKFQDWLLGAFRSSQPTVSAHPSDPTDPTQASDAVTPAQSAAAEIADEPSNPANETDQVASADDGGSASAPGFEALHSELGETTGAALQPDLSGSNSAQVLDGEISAGEGEPGTGAPSLHSQSQTGAEAIDTTQLAEAAVAAPEPPARETDAVDDQGSASTAGSIEVGTEFNESFEVAKLTDLAGWNGGQLVRGEISIRDGQAHSGDSALYMHSDNNVGKAHLFKSGYWVDEGDQAQVVAHVFIPSGTSLKNLYILDWESKSVWSPDNTAPNTQPGIRIGFHDDDGGIVVERGKLGLALEKDFVNPDFVMPRDEWVKIEWRLKVGLDDEGATQVLVNDQMVIDAHGTTYIDPDVAEEYEILLNEDYAFDRVKLGITANSTAQDIDLYFDDATVNTWDDVSGTDDWLFG